MTAIAVTLVIVTIACIAWASLFDRTWPVAEREPLPPMRVVTDDGTGSRSHDPAWDRMWNARVPAPPGPDVFSGRRAITVVNDTPYRQIEPTRSLPVHEHPHVVHPPS